jgi:hypothetical protein
MIIPKILSIIAYRLSLIAYLLSLIAYRLYYRLLLNTALDYYF